MAVSISRIARRVAPGFQTLPRNALYTEISSGGLRLVCGLARRHIRTTCDRGLTQQRSNAGSGRTAKSCTSVPASRRGKTAVVTRDDIVERGIRCIECGIDETHG